MHELIIFVQVFDNSGRILKDFGSYGNSEGEFDCLAGVAVNRIGQYIIADRYNHRIQVKFSNSDGLRTLHHAERIIVKKNDSIKYINIFYFVPLGFGPIWQIFKVVRKSRFQ